MSKVICIAGESGSGKTTSMRNLDPKSTYYIDADKKGLSWKGWRKQYNKENKNYFACDDASVVRQYIKRIAEAYFKWQKIEALRYPHIHLNALTADYTVTRLVLEPM